MTTKKTPKAAAPKSKSLSEPAAATKTVKPSKATLARAAAKPVLEEGPVAPTVAAARNAAKVASVTFVDAPAAVAPAAPVAAESLTVGQFQRALYTKGFYGGHWDGHYGPLTKAAVRSFQASQKLPVDGEPTPATLAALGF